MVGASIEAYLREICIQVKTKHRKNQRSLQVLQNISKKPYFAVNIHKIKNTRNPY